MRNRASESILMYKQINLTHGDPLTKYFQAFIIEMSERSDSQVS
jgi:hypothetical protein